MRGRIAAIGNYPAEKVVSIAGNEEKGLRSWWSLPLAILVVSLLSVGAAIWIGVKGARHDTIPFEVVKALLQLGVVSAGVAALSLITYRYQKKHDGDERDREYKRDQEELRRQLVRSALERATANYTAVKRARRLLRVQAKSCNDATANYTAVKRARWLPRVQAKSCNDATKFEYDYSDKCISIVFYYKQMNRLDDAQLEFENLKREVEATRDRYERNASEIIESLGCIETYLGKLVTEWENKRNKWQPEENGTDVKIGKLSSLDQLVTTDKTGDFHTKFASQFRELRKFLIEELEPEERVQRGPVART